MLCFDLDNNDSESTALLHQVFMKCLEELHLDTADITDIATRSSPREVQLIVMRFLSVIMSRSKSGGKSSTQVRSQPALSLCSVFVLCLRALSSCPVFVLCLRALSDDSQILKHLFCRRHHQCPPRWLHLSLKTTSWIIVLQY
jgi:E3 ubiquitin-protein ligase UBR4